MAKSEIALLSKTKIAHIIRDYNLGEPEQFVAIEQGRQSSNYLLKTKNGKFLIKIFNKTMVNSAKLEDILGIYKFLCENGVKTSYPIKNRNKKFVYANGKSKIAVLTFVDGICASKQRLSVLKICGSQLGRIDRTLAKAPSNGLKFEGGAIKFVEKMMKKHPVKNEMVNNEFKMLKREFLLLKNSRTPISIIHGDPKLSAFIFQNNRFNGIIDFGAARKDYTLMDPAFLIFRLKLYKKRNLPKLRTFVCAYSKSCGISGKDIKLLPIFVRAANLVEFYFSWYAICEDSKKSIANKKAAEKLNKFESFIEDFDNKLFTQSIESALCNNDLHVYVGGPSGVGKTTLARFFKRKGINAIDGDLEIGKWLNPSGRRIYPPDKIGKNINSWAKERNLRWVCNERKVKEILNANRNSQLYLFGGPRPKALDNFDRIFYLKISKSLMLHRILKRLNDKNAYHRNGESAKQRRQMLEELNQKYDDAKRSGYELVDASKSTRKIYKTIMRLLNNR